MTGRRFRMLRCPIDGINAVAADTQHAFPRHTHDQFGIGVIDRGAQKSASGRGQVEAGPGDTITVNPGEVHDGAPIGEGGRAWRMLYFDPILVANTVNDTGQARAGTVEFCHPVITDRRVAVLFRNLFTVVTDSRRGADALLRDELLALLLAAVVGERNDDAGKQDTPRGISAMRRLIDDDPARRLTLFDLARESGLSRFQVIRGFVKTTGFTPHAYIVQRRIDTARKLIIEGMPLADAAVSSGFSDQSHLTRVFVRRYGVSPRAYADATT